MAGSRAARALRLFRRHRQQLWLAPLPEPSRQSMAWHTEAAQPKATTVVGSLQRSSARQPSAAAPARSHLARASDLKREYSSEEPDAGKLQVRICGGGGGRPPPLPDQCPGHSRLVGSCTVGSQRVAISVVVPRLDRRSEGRRANGRDFATLQADL